MNWHLIAFIVIGIIFILCLIWVFIQIGNDAADRIIDGWERDE